MFAPVGHGSGIIYFERLILGYNMGFLSNNKVLVSIILLISGVSAWRAMAILGFEFASQATWLVAWAPAAAQEARFAPTRPRGST
jgi:hypothetical protein